jgi:MazG family protein
MNKIPFKVSNTPNKSTAAEALGSFMETIAALRDPINGCPWDLEQTHKTLKRYMIEEAFEAAEAMDENDPKELCDELGDVLLQVVLNAQLAFDQKDFSLTDVIQSIDAKMKRRHPHVFGNKKERSEREVSQIKTKWKQIKEEEKKEKSLSQPPKKPSGIFDGENIEKIIYFPGHYRAL